MGLGILSFIICKIASDAVSLDEHWAAKLHWVGFERITPTALSSTDTNTRISNYALRRQASKGLQQIWHPLPEIVYSSRKLGKQITKPVTVQRRRWITFPFRFSQCYIYPCTQKLHRKYISFSFHTSLALRNLALLFPFDRRTSAQLPDLLSHLNSCLEPDHSNAPPHESAFTVIVLFCVWHGPQRGRVSASTESKALLYSIKTTSPSTDTLQPKVGVSYHGWKTFPQS